jgi:voltage-gated potassium channel
MSRSHILFITFLVFILAVIGTSGYMMIEGWDTADSLYMTIITLTTTGYQEVHPMSQAGRTFTMVLLVCGMGVVAYSVSAIMNFVLNIDFQKRRINKMKKEISELRDHTIVCGYGRIGRVICKELEYKGVDFVVVEKGDEQIKKLTDEKYYYIHGDAAADEILEEAGIQHATSLVSMIDNDADGLYLCLAARSLNPKLRIIVRASDERAKKRIEKAGANKVILPIIMSGKRIAESVVNPAVEDFLDVAGAYFEKGEGIQLADILVDKKSHLIGISIKDFSNVVNDLVIVAIRKDNGEFIFFPKDDYLFVEGDTLVSIATEVGFNKTLEHFSIDLNSQV